MTLRTGLFGGCLLMAALVVGAEERLNVCFNYGCVAQAEVAYSDRQLHELAVMLLAVGDAAGEREAISVAIGRMLGWAGKQTPIFADRGGNFPDGLVNGRMDCIDHSMTTTRLLRLLEKQGWLRFHRVLEPVRRNYYLIFDHFAAQIEESVSARSIRSDTNSARYVVDSWFFDNGQPAVVMLLASWLAGEGPDVDE